MRDQGCRCGRDDLIKGADCLTGGLHAQTVHQVEGLNSIIECGRAVVGRTRSVGQGTWVDSGYRAILIMNVGGEFGILGALTASTHLLAATAVVASLPLGRSVSAATAVGPALLLLLPLGLLLLLGELRVRLFALHSAKFVGLWGLTTGTVRGTLLLK